MATKKEFTIEELEAQYKALGEELEARKKAEKEEREAKLAAEKDARYKEVIDAYENYEELRNKFADDYGYFYFSAKSEDGEECKWLIRQFGIYQ
jgi:flagellar motility protein MotE (MotC chaperone)